jgi:hypothetical protein
MVEQMEWGTALRRENRDLSADGEDFHCEACWVLIQRDGRAAYLECGLCELCDAQLSPYPRQPSQDDPRWPGGLSC